MDELNPNPQFYINELTWLEHQEWSDRNFGTGGPVGSLKHLSAEALEAAEDPTDIIEYADCMFLMMDSLHRGGFTWEQLNEAMAKKMAILQKRTYNKTPEGEPSFHVKDV